MRALRRVVLMLGVAAVCAGAGSALSASPARAGSVDDELTLALPGYAAREGAAPDALALIGSGRFSGGDVASCAEARVRSAHGDEAKY